MLGIAHAMRGALLRKKTEIAKNCNKIKGEILKNAANIWFWLLWTRREYTKFTAVRREPFTRMDATPMVNRCPAGSTSTACKPGITVRPKDGDPEGAADFTAEDWIGFSSLWAYQLPNPTGLCQSATKTVRRRCSSDRDRISDNLLLFCLITAFR